MVSARDMRLTLAAMTLASSMILVDQTAVPLASHVTAFEVTFAVSAGIALLGAVACLLLVRKSDRIKTGPIFARRSRWVYVSQGRSPLITKRPRRPNRTRKCDVRVHTRKGVYQFS